MTNRITNEEEEPNSIIAMHSTTQTAGGNHFATNATTNNNNNNNNNNNGSHEATGGYSPPSELHATLSADHIPSHLIIRHRMGYSTIQLTEKQQSTYTQEDLEAFVLYKERKYNHINVLDRFCIFIILFLALCIIAHSISLGTSEWTQIRVRSKQYSTGPFFTCNGTIGMCQDETFTLRNIKPFFLFNSTTGSILCSNSVSSIRLFLISMWSLSIIQLLLLVIAFLLTLRLSFRPTRTSSSIWILLIVFFASIISIGVTVLFYFFSRCQRKTCEAQVYSNSKYTIFKNSSHNNTIYTGVDSTNNNSCSVNYRWGFNSYVAATVMDIANCVILVRLHSYVRKLRGSAERHLQTEKKRRQPFVDSTALDPENNNNEYDGSDTRDLTMSVVRTSVSPSSLARHSQFVDAAPDSKVNSITAIQGDNKNCSNHYNKNSHSSANTPQSQATGASAFAKRHSLYAGLHVAFAGEETSSTKQILLHDDITNTNTTNNIQTLPKGYPAVLSATQTKNPKENGHPETKVDGTGPSTLKKHRPSGGIPNNNKKKKKNYLHRHLFSRRYDPEYLTAMELNVSIAGAEDWVYDDKSDMYYSFDLGMFWDPPTREYYNCRLEIWQKDPQGFVEVRDAKEYATKDEEERENASYCSSDD